MSLQQRPSVTQPCTPEVRGLSNPHGGIGHQLRARRREVRISRYHAVQADPQQPIIQDRRDDPGPLELLLGAAHVELNVRSRADVAHVTLKRLAVEAERKLE